MDESAPGGAAYPVITEDTMMRSTLGTMICFLVLGFFLMASAGRAESARIAVTNEYQPPAVSYASGNTAGKQPGY